MPTLLPRESMDTTSVIPASTQRPSPSDHRVGFSSSFTRLLTDSLALRPALLLFGNSRPRVATTPLPHATGADGQLPGRDFNPLDLLLLLRTGQTRYSWLSNETAGWQSSVHRFRRDTPCGAHLLSGVTRILKAHASAVRVCLRLRRARAASRVSVDCVA